MEGSKTIWWFDEDGRPMVGSSGLLDWEESQDALIDLIAPEEESEFDLGPILAELTPRQRFVIERRYGIFDGFMYSQQLLAACLGVSWQAVQSLEEAGLRKMRWLLGDL